MGVPEKHDTEVISSHSCLKFTAVVTTYNYAHLLPDALRTIAAQTLQDFELLVVDDGSTDNTKEVVERFRPRFQDCSYLKKRHTGPADTRNFALQEARGTHIAFLDADDLWSPRYLETVYNRLKSSPQAEIVLSNGLRVRDNGMIMRPVFPAGVPQLEGPVTSVENLFSLCTNFLPSGMVILKSLYVRVGPFDTDFDHGERLGDDVDWFIRAVIAGAYCVNIDRSLFLYRFHGRNLTTNPVDFLVPWLRIYRDRLKDSPLGPECEHSARNFTRNYVLRLLGSCSPSKGRTLLAQTLETIPGDVILRCAYLSTFFGSSYALRILRLAKRVMRNGRSPKQQVDLSASPELIFQGE